MEAIITGTFIMKKEATARTYSPLFLPQRQAHSMTLPVYERELKFAHLSGSLSLELFLDGYDAM